LLTDLAHNLLADFQHRALIGSRFENYGPKRIIRDLLRIPGNLTPQRKYRQNRAAKSQCAVGKSNFRKTC